MNLPEKKYEEIPKLFCVETSVGYSEEELAAAREAVGKIPSALMLFYEKYAKSPELQGLQDMLVLPGESYPALLIDDYIVFFVENQGVCQAAVKKSDADMPDPPVYVNMDFDDEWVLSSEHVSDFLVAMYGYQASICLEYNPEEFYFITADEIEKIESRFKKRPEVIKSWLGYELTMYGNDYDGRIALMNNGGDEDISMSYAANTKEEFERMKSLLSDIGEAI